jgi:hypothetical protein
VQQRLASVRRGHDLRRTQVNADGRRIESNPPFIVGGVGLEAGYFNSRSALHGRALCDLA